MRLRLDQYVLALILLLVIMLGMCQHVNGQDSTFSHCKEVIIVDSVLFVGDTARYEMNIDAEMHYGKRQFYLTDSHRWKERDNERICSRCLRWEKFHVEEQAVYTYDPFYVAKLKILNLKGKK